MIRSLNKFVLTTVALASTVSAVGYAQTAAVTRHTREEVTSKVAPLVGHLSTKQNMELTLVLPHRNQTDLDQFLKNVYDRSKPEYRHFLTVDQFTQKYGPSREDYDSVTAWAKQSGLKVLSTARNRQIVRVSGSAQSIEKALNVQLNNYQHPTENRVFYAPDREPTPNLGVRLWSIAGLDNFSRPVSQITRRDPSTVHPDDIIANATTGSCPSKSFCGSDMRAAYYTAGGGTLTGAGQSVGIFNFIGTDLDDLNTYFTNAGQVNNVPVTLLSVDGQQTTCLANQGCDDTEPTLDMTQSISMAPAMSSLVMYIGKGGLSGQSLDDPGILNAMATASPLNNQLSCSWAWRPADPTTDDPFFEEFQAQGQSFFTASGDSGNWANASFVWPADDPNIVSVGGTDLKTVSAGGAWSSETGWVDGGGGITKNGFAIPSYQVAAAAGCTKCSQTLRNGPDVSANSDFTFYVCSDQSGCTANNFGGTSFATPMWAGFMALANQQAVANGNGPIGFPNPDFYSIYGGANYAADFHDILTGGNSLGSTTGYDLATGIGSPTGQSLIDDLAGSTQGGSFTLSASTKGVSIAKGASGQAGIKTVATGSFNSAVSLSATGTGSGIQVAFNPSTIAAPGSGRAVMRIKVTANATAGNHVITITATGGSVTQTTTVTVVVH